MYMYVVQMLLYIFRMLNACPVCHITRVILVLMGIQVMKLTDFV